MLATDFSGQTDDELFTKILFVPPQLSGRPQTPTASAPPGTPGPRTSGRTPSRTPQPPPLNTALEEPFETTSSGAQGRRQHGAHPQTGGMRLLEWTSMEDQGGPSRGRIPQSNIRHSEYMDTWVTLFGFSQEDFALVLQEFLKCGDIITYDASERGPAGNWTHVQYRTPEGAQRALQKNGISINGNLIVGVQPPSLSARALIQDEMASAPPLEEDFREEREYRVALTPPRPVQTTGQPTPVKGPFNINEHRPGSAVRSPMQEKDMPQPSWSGWLRPIGVLFGL
ncbi:hypothetical protein BSKO_03540 [Bryopsis sp. KO-2023]|nr:hypothetical protein BSKO_03540 [Bryopsis sp. KO-2023]